MAKAGFDWLAIDLEHSCIDMTELQSLVQVIDLAGVAPLVRLTNNNPNLIKRCMDAGATGIIVPMVLDASDAAKAVQAVYYPPRGRRGVGLARAQGYGAGFIAYKDWLETEAVVIVQIEHISAVSNIEAILQTSGVDGYIIGPYDLSASMGMPGALYAPEVLAAIERVHEAGRRLRKAGGLHVVEPDLALARQCFKDGLTFVAYSLDIRILDSVCRSAVSTLREGIR